jgi:hypothetical protein
MAVAVKTLLIEPRLNAVASVLSRRASRSANPDRLLEDGRAGPGEQHDSGEIIPGGQAVDRCGETRDELGFA